MAEGRDEASSGDPYQNPSLARHLDSFEGTAELYSELSIRLPIRRRSLKERANAGFASVGEMLPGLVLAAFLAFAAEAMAHWIGTVALDFEKSPVSAIMLTIAIGLFVRNTVGLPEVYDAGVRFCVRGVLRIGVALLGLRLSLSALGSLGFIAIPIVVGCIGTALLVVSFVGRRLGLPPRLASLIAVGTSICGVSAIVATAPVLGADDDEVAYSVACVTLFGMLAVFVYPFLANWMFAGDAHQMGLFLGTAIHDTAQVAAAGLVAQQQFGMPEAMNTALVVKLVRNLFMIAVIPLLAVMHARGGAVGGVAPRWYELVPLFVVGFVVMVLVRTLGDSGTLAFGVLDPEVWREMLSASTRFATWMLMLAMAGVGLGTRFSSLQRLGWRPLVGGSVAAASVGSASVLLIRMLA